MIAGSTNLLEISVAISDEFSNQTVESTGGTITTMASVLSQLLDKHEVGDELQDLDLNLFTQNIVNSTSSVFGLSLGWKEISDEDLKYSAVSKYLTNLDYSAFLWADKSIRTRDLCDTEASFVFPSVSAVSKLTSKSSGEQCFHFPASGSICIPSTELKDSCNVLVATTVDTKTAMDTPTSNIFPSRTDYYGDSSLLGKNVIGLTINNNTQLANSSVKITFNHEALYSGGDGCWLVPGEPQCNFWDTQNNQWDPHGCQVSEDSDLDMTICECNHLTNFGIMLDWEGKAPANDPALDGISMFLLVFSCLSLAMTEIILMCQRQDKRSKLRRVAETNRNICLFIAQVAFIAFSGQYRGVNCGTCQAFGVLTHFFWLTFFSWTMIEGYFFYTALVTVFEPERFRIFIFYLLGYGIPALIVCSTITAGELTEGFYYLRRDTAGRVNSCWLQGDAVFSFLVPVGLVIVFNVGITCIAITVAYKAGARRNVSSQARIISTMRNTVLISLLLGLTWIVGFLPYSIAQQYMTVILNASMGIYILFYSVLANTQVRRNLKEQVSGIISSARKETSTTETFSNNVKSVGMAGLTKRGSADSSTTAVNSSKPAVNSSTTAVNGSKPAAEKV